MSSNLEISNSLSFLSKKNIRTISSYNSAIAAYNAGISSAAKLTGDIPIFLDANVLLRYYSISFKAREKLIKFFSDYKARIYISAQVQKEFLRNREDVISRFFNDVTEELPESFQKDILNKVESFLNQNKVVLKDYLFIEKGLEKIKAQGTELLEKLNNEVKTKEKENKNIILSDLVLASLNNTNNLPSLSDKEIKIITDDYDSLCKNINKEKIDTFISSIDNAFPGLGDYRNKPDDPYGDYIIFHEIMSFIANNKCDAIFLTNDVTKGDWMQKNGKAHLHYIENVFLNTGQILYILDAERIFEDILDISFKSLLDEVIGNEELEITEDSLLDYLNNCETLKVYKSILSIDSRYIEELRDNNYIFVKELAADLEKSKKALYEHSKLSPNKLNKIGGMRTALSILNRNYKRYPNKAPVPSDFYDRNYEEFRKYLQ